MKDDQFSIRSPCELNDNVLGISTSRCSAGAKGARRFHLGEQISPPASGRRLRPLRPPRSDGRAINDRHKGSDENRATEQRIHLWRKDNGDLVSGSQAASRRTVEGESENDDRVRRTRGGKPKVIVVEGCKRATGGGLYLGFARQGETDDGKPPLHSFHRISAQMGWEGLTVQKKLSCEVD